MKKLSSITISLIALTIFGVVIAAESIKYDFDNVEVRYAAEFIAKPISVDPNSWIVQIAGGVDQPVTVLFGVVYLKKGDGTQISEEFIKVSGRSSSERFLVTSGRYDYYGGAEAATRDSKYKNIKSFFWSAKKLIGNDVVKDFTLPIRSITFYRDFDEAQQPSSIMLWFSNDGSKSGAEFWLSVPTENFYKVDMNTLNQSGVPTATISK